MASLIGLMLGTLMSCGIHQRMPEGKLLSLEYTRSGTMAGYKYETHVTTEPNGDVVLRAMKENYGPLYEKKLTAEEVAGFVKLIEEEKMYNYKEKYRPVFEVLDGDTWYLDIRFEQGTIKSGGYHSWPKGDGLSRIREYSISLLSN